MTRQRRRHLQDTQAWGRRVLQGHDEQMAVIARELHDDVLQQFEGARLKLISGHEPAVVNTALVNAMTAMRELSRNTHPATVDQLTLSAALSEFATSRHAPRIHVVIDGTEGMIPVLAKRHLYRVAQQAIRNAVEHADASQVTVELEARGAWIMLRVRDDGRGFNADRAPTRGIGLRSMQERMAAIGGMLTVETTAGRGTTVTAAWPREGTNA